MCIERKRMTKPRGRSQNPLAEIRIVLSHWQHNSKNPENIFRYDS